MDGYQFMAAIFSSLVSLAWPAALVICVLLFRERLQTLLPFLKLKHKDTEISFRLDQAEKESAEIAQTDLQQTPPELLPTPEEKSRFEKIAEHSPRAAILEKRAELEQAMRIIAQSHWSGTTTSTPSPRSISLLTATRILRKAGVIDEKTSALLDDLRAIGNQAAHESTDGSEFTKEAALRFGRLADNAIAYVKMLE
ncbi:DUF4145 domain-containing protein [Bradyrhizobium sp. LLZ17]|uniref:DUF4145 domain-containing protein n=1 Tax=Bradyrhizobium sp. LLZ17 TaxID=3239388 RepID=A0AB39XD04_9BRAD